MGGCVRREDGGAPGRGLAGLVVLFFLLGGCAAIGAHRVPADRFDYNEAIARSAREQMLTNLVRIRYLDFPAFLSVSSVITSYTYQGGVGVQGAVGIDNPAVDQVGGSANLSYSERPTITYTPISGHEFTRRLLTPIPVEAIFALAQAGWAVDVLLLTGINRINDVSNMSFAAVPPPGEVEMDRQRREDAENARRFQRVVRLMLSLAERGAIEFQKKDSGNGRLPNLVIGRHLSEEDRALVDELRDLLNLDPSRDVFRVTTRKTRRAPDEITIQSRSLFAIMAFVSKGIDTPRQHREKGWTAGSPVFSESGNRIVPFHAKVSKDRPKEAYLSVRYKGYWFYIDPADTDSKRIFNYLLALFQLQAPAAGSGAPLVTLPAG